MALFPHCVRYYTHTHTNMHSGKIRAGNEHTRKRVWEGQTPTSRVKVHPGVQIHTRVCVEDTARHTGDAGVNEVLGGASGVVLRKGKRA